MTQHEHELCAFGDMLAFYADVGRADAIWPYMEVCARHGLLYSDKDTFMMARPVNSSLPPEDLNNLADLSSERQKRELTFEYDAWHIIYASGKITDFFAKAPFTLPKVMWQRDGGGPMRIYPYKKLENLIHGKLTR
jgi:hypothetical protein